MKSLKEYAFTIYSYATLASIHDYACDEAYDICRHDNRNRFEMTAHIFKKMIKGGYMECWNRGKCYRKETFDSLEDTIVYEIDSINSGDIIFRICGKEFGCASHSDYRYGLDIVTVDHVCDKIIIGTYGERVTIDSIIAIGRK